METIAGSPRQEARRQTAAAEARSRVLKARPTEASPATSPSRDVFVVRLSGEDGAGPYGPRRPCSAGAAVLIRGAKQADAHAHVDPVRAAHPQGRREFLVAVVVLAAPAILPVSDDPAHADFPDRAPLAGLWLVGDHHRAQAIRGGRAGGDAHRRGAVGGRPGSAQIGGLGGEGRRRGGQCAGGEKERLHGELPQHAPGDRAPGGEAYTRRRRWSPHGDPVDARRTPLDRDRTALHAVSTPSPHSGRKDVFCAE